MNRNIRFRYGSYCCILIFLAMITGCAAKTHVLPVTPPPPLIDVTSREGFQWIDNDLADRFQQYWSLRRAGDSAGSFAYEAPHVKEMVVRGRYDGLYERARKDWKSIRAEKINRITDQLIEIDFNMISKTNDGEQREIFYRDSWLLFSGNWFHVLKDPFLTGDGFGK